MKRWRVLLAGPEAIMCALTLGVYWFCAQHASGEGRDVLLVERVLMALPLIAAPLVFLSFLALDRKSWWSTLRINLALYVGLIVSATRLVEAFGEGAKGQDAGVMMVLGTGVLLGAAGNCIAGTATLAATRPGCAMWLRRHRLLGGLLIALSTIPIAVALIIGVIVLVTLLYAVQALVN